MASKPYGLAAIPDIVTGRRRLYTLFCRPSCAGKRWTPERFIQRDPEGRPFTNHYNVMNGQFVRVSQREWPYVFGQFGVDEKIYRILALHLEIT